MGSITYNGPALVISGNAGNVTYTLGPQETIKVSVTNSAGTEEFTVKAYNDNTSRTMDLAEILNALPLNLPSPQSQDVAYNIYKPSTVKLAVMNGSTEVSSFTIQVIRGLVSDKSISATSALGLLNLKAHTVKPQIRYTYAGSIENLSVMIPWGIIASPSANTPTVTYNVTLYLKGGTTQAISWYNTLASCEYKVVTNRVDLEAVLEHLSGPTPAIMRRLIVGWDVQVVISEPSIVSAKTLNTVRYILKDGRAKSRSFAFINDFGGIDTITANGSFKTVGSYSPALFINDDNLETIKTNQETEYEVNTGPLDNVQDQEAWLSFLRSPNKWLVEGWSFRKISLTDASPELESKELNDITFKFRPENEKGGAVPEYSTLAQM
ncbi:MAG: hypothetical protein IJK44_02985 [Bacteroidales bacterium]|nr:hypothetical protein [Bacteroidales bacterium]